MLCFRSNHAVEDTQRDMEPAVLDGPGLHDVHSDAELELEAELEPSVLIELPQDVWCDVLTYLDQKELLEVIPVVNKRFHVLGSQPAAWRRLTLHDERAFTRMVASRRCSLLQHVEFGGDFVATSDSVGTISLKMPHLKTLSLENSRALDDDAFIQFNTLVLASESDSAVQPMRLVRQVSGSDVVQTACLPREALSAFHVQESWVTVVVDDAVERRESQDELDDEDDEEAKQEDDAEDDSVVRLNSRDAKLFEYCGFPFLEKLSVARCPNITSSAIRQIASGCPQLESINIDLCVKIDKSGIEALVTQCRNLRHLSMRACGFVNEDTLKLVVDNLPGLETLRVASCGGVNDDGMMQVARLSKLRFLDVSSCWISDEVLAEVVRSCPDIRSLLCYMCIDVADGTVAAVAEHLHDLEVLDIRKSRITDESLDALSRSPLRPKSLNFYYCSHLSNAALGGLSSIFSRLEHLVLTACMRLEDSGLRAIVEHAPRIRVLNLSYLRQLTDDGLAGLVQHCEQLRVLNVTHCSGLTDAGLGQLAQLPCLSNLVVSYTKFGDRALLALAEHESQLQRVDMAYCPVSNVGIAALARSSPLLHTLALSGCTAVSDPGISALARHCPKLRCLKSSMCTHSVLSVELLEELCPELDMNDVRRTFAMNCAKRPRSGGVFGCAVM